VHIQTRSVEEGKVALEGVRPIFIMRGTIYLERWRRGGWALRCLRPTFVMPHTTLRQVKALEVELRSTSAADKRTYRDKVEEDGTGWKKGHKVVG